MLLCRTALEIIQFPSCFRKLTFLANNLSTLELFQLLNKHLQPLIPKEEAPTNVLVAKIKQKVQRK